MADQGSVQPAPNELTTLTLAELYDRQQIANELASQAKAGAALLQTEIDNRLSASAKAAYAEAGKGHGTLTLPLQGGLEAKIDISKRVEWDSDKLLAVAQTLPWERAIAIFKMAFSVPEKIYAGIAAAVPDLAAKIDEARTIKIGEPKITLQKVG